MDLKRLWEDTSSGGAAPFTRARLGGGEDKVVRKPTEKKKGAGMKPDALVSFVTGYKKKR